MNAPNAKVTTSKRLSFLIFPPSLGVHRLKVGKTDLPADQIVTSFPAGISSLAEVSWQPLFSPTDTYLGQSKFTDADGKAIFDLPQKDYKVRADYLGQQFWSEDFQSQDVTMTIQQGLAKIHAQRSGNDAAGAKVYLFNETGSYLGWNEITDPTGIAEFLLPDRAYKFRIDENGEQHWTPLIQIHAGEQSMIDFDLDH